MANQEHLVRLKKGIDAWNRWRRQSLNIHPDFSGAHLREADLREADLSGADLYGAHLVRADFTGATLSRCRVYGTSVWNVKLQGTKQDSLIITPDEEAEITVDTLEVAQFIYLLVNNPSIRQVIDTIAKKAVLILGRFTPERKAILELLRDELRNRGYVPNEVAMIADTCITPLQPLILETQHDFAMFADLQRRYHRVLPTYRYKDADDLRASLDAKIIAAEKKAQDLMQPHHTEDTT